MQPDTKQMPEERLITLLEHLHHHNVDHCEELAECRAIAAGCRAGELLAEAVDLMERANGRLLDAVIALKGGE